MRIAVLSDTIMPTPFDRGHGLGRSVYNAASQLVRRGHGVTLYGAIGSDLPGGYVVTTGLMTVDGESVLAEEIARWRDSFDVALDCGHRHALANKCVLPTVAWFQDIASSRAPCAAFVSEYARGAVGQGGVIIRNGIDPDVYVLGDGERGNHLIWLGHNDAHKGLTVAQQVAGLCGRELRAFGRGCPNGEVGTTDKIRELQQAAVLLCPYLIDAGAHVPLEAMACGTPVVAYRKGCLPEYVPYGGGLLGEHVNDLATLVPLAEGLGAQAVRRAVLDAGFTVDRLGAEIEAVLVRVANGERW